MLAFVETEPATQRQRTEVALAVAQASRQPAAQRWQASLYNNLGMAWHEAGRDEHRRLALFEERSAIARELHDSIAQSLTYTKIQLARLSALIGRGEAARESEAREVVEELRTGVSTAYQQLRELLTKPEPAAVRRDCTDAGSAV